MREVRNKVYLRQRPRKLSLGSGWGCQVAELAFPRRCSGVASGGERKDGSVVKKKVCFWRKQSYGEMKKKERKSYFEAT